MRLDEQPSPLDEGTKARLAARKDIELRMQCLQLAVGAYVPGVSQGKPDFITEAEKFLSFVTGHAEKS